MNQIRWVVWNAERHIENVFQFENVRNKNGRFIAAVERLMEAAYQIVDAGGRINIEKVIEDHSGL